MQKPHQINKETLTWIVGVFSPGPHDEDDKAVFLTTAPHCSRKLILSLEGILIIAFCPFEHDRDHKVFHKRLRIIIVAMSGNLKLQAFVLPFQSRPYFRLYITLKFHRLE